MPYVCVLCDNTCVEKCSNDCSVICALGCDTTCHGDCDTTCEGQCINTCTKICSDDCIGGCYGDCSSNCADSCSSGCGDSCSNTCKNNCGESCSTACNSTCAGAAQDVNYEAIRTLKRKYTKEDISNLSTFIINEAKRRGATPTNANFTQRGKINPDEINKIVDNLKLSNYTTTKVTSRTRGSYDWLIDLKDKAIQAYKVVVPVS